MKDQTTNPKGKNGKPITLAPLTFDEAVRKMLGTPPPTHEPKAQKQRKKPAKK